MSQDDLHALLSGSYAGWCPAVRGARQVLAVPRVVPAWIDGEVVGRFGARRAMAVEVNV